MKRRATHKKVSVGKRVARRVWGGGGGKRCDRDIDGVTVDARGKGQKPSIHSQLK